MNISVSIIVPVFNVEKYISDCLNSLIKQDLTSYEIICVNDGSPDNSSKIIKDFQKRHNNIILINQENQGLSGARNTGIKHAKGEYLLFVDSDDFLEPNTLKHLYRKAKEYNLDIIDFKVNAFSKGKKMPWKPNYIKTSKPLNGRQYFLNLIYKTKQQPNVSAWTHMYKTEFIKKNNLRFIPGKYYEDLPFTAEAYLLAEKVLFEDLFVYNYRTNPGSITRKSVNEKQIDDLVFISNKIFEISQKYEVSIPMDNFFSGLRKKLLAISNTKKQSDLSRFLSPNIFKNNKFRLLRRKNKVAYNLFRYIFFLKAYLLFNKFVNLK